MKVEYGPIQLIVVGFPENDFSGEIIDELKRLRNDKMIRVVGLRMMIKDENGDMIDAQYSDLSDEEKEKLGASIGALIGLGAGGREGAMEGAEMGMMKVAERDFGLTQEEVDEILNEIPNDSSIGILIVEHLWAKDLKQKIRDAGGMMIAQGLLSPALLVKIGMLLDEGE